MRIRRKNNFTHIHVRTHPPHTSTSRSWNLESISARIVMPRLHFPTRITLSSCTPRRSSSSFPRDFFINILYAFLAFHIQASHSGYNKFPYFTTVIVQRSCRPINYETIPYVRQSFPTYFILLRVKYFSRHLVFTDSQCVFLLSERNGLTTAQKHVECGRL
jgi:hypothetical protein